MRLIFSCFLLTIKMEKSGDYWRTVAIFVILNHIFDLTSCNQNNFLPQATSNKNSQTTESCFGHYATNMNMVCVCVLLCTPTISLYPKVSKTKQPPNNIVNKNTVKFCKYCKKT